MLIPNIQHCGHGSPVPSSSSVGQAATTSERTASAARNGWFAMGSLGLKGMERVPISALMSHHSHPKPIPFIPYLIGPILGFFCTHALHLVERRPPATDQARHSQALHLRCKRLLSLEILNVLQLDLIFHTHSSNSPESRYSDIWASKLVPLTHKKALPGATSISRLRFTSVLWLCSKRRAMSFTVFGTW